VAESLIYEHELHEVLRGFVKESGSQLEVARALNITPQYLSDILRQKRSISQVVATRLGYREVRMFERRVLAKEVPPCLT
jgi:hypothetical protein